MSITGNCTIDPAAQATAVSKPQITEIRSLKSGAIFRLETIDWEFALRSPYTLSQQLT